MIMITTPVCDQPRDATDSFTQLLRTNSSAAGVKIPLKSNCWLAAPRLIVSRGHLGNRSRVTRTEEAQAAPLSLRSWLMKGAGEEHQAHLAAHPSRHQTEKTHHWWHVMCLTGVDYFSTSTRCPRNLPDCNRGASGPDSARRAAGIPPGGSRESERRRSLSRRLDQARHSTIRHVPGSVRMEHRRDAEPVRRPGCPSTSTDFSRGLHSPTRSNSKTHASLGTRRLPMTGLSYMPASTP
jgi:hypothetical protein